MDVPNLNSSQEFLKEGATLSPTTPLDMEEAITSPISQDQDSLHQSNEVEDNQGVNLNKTPRKKKPKRKRYTPKVIKESKPKPSNAPKTPAKTSDTRVKRKYRRKANNEDGGVDRPVLSEKTTQSHLDFDSEEEIENSTTNTPLVVMTSRLHQDDDCKRMLSHIGPPRRAELDYLKELVEKNCGQHSATSFEGVDLAEPMDRLLATQFENQVPIRQPSEEENQGRCLNMTLKDDPKPTCKPMIIKTYVPREKKEVGKERYVNYPDSSPHETMTRNQTQGKYKSMLSKFLSTGAELEDLNELTMRNSVQNATDNCDKSLEGGGVVDVEKCDRNSVDDWKIYGTTNGIGDVSFCQLFSTVPKRKRTRMRRKSLVGQNPWFFGVQKKRRTKVAQRRVACSSGWKHWKPFSNTSEVVTFDAEWFTAIEKAVSLKCKMASSCIQVVDFHEVSIAADCNQSPPPPKKVPTCSDVEKHENYGPNSRIAALTSMQMCLKNRRHREKKQVSCVDPITSYAIPKKIISFTHKIVASSSWSSSSSSLAEPILSRSKKRKKVMNMDPMSCIIERLMSLNINDVTENALVPFAPTGTMVPFVHNREKKYRPEVYLSPESERIYKVWQRSISSDDGSEIEEIDMKWEEEAQAFLQRVDSFIDKMWVIGDKEYSKWKGSVMDSIVGVYLTQNVSDSHSSSAFMSLAAKFPAHSKDEPKAGQPIIQDKNPILNSKACLSQKVPVEKVKNTQKNQKKNAPKDKKEKHFEWNRLREQAIEDFGKKERSDDTMDSLDYEAILKADVSEIADAIKDRGQHNQLAQRIQDCLRCIADDHGSVDLEWLMNIPPEKAKEYLLDINGLGLKSVECVRLLALQHQAFPVDTNVARLTVRLGLVPLEPLPESRPFHLLETYPAMENVQKYLWPRLCRLDHKKLFLLHYIMITVGKVFCTKVNPNCNACPMKSECKHFASAAASAKPALPPPQKKHRSRSSSRIHIAFEEDLNLNPSCALEGPLSQNQTGRQSGEPTVEIPSTPKHECTGNGVEMTLSKNLSGGQSGEPIIEEPSTPEHEYMDNEENGAEDTFFDDSDETGVKDSFSDDHDEILTLDIRGFKEFRHNGKNYMQDYSMGHNYGDLSKALVAASPQSISIPMVKPKNVIRLRTEHLVYLLPDSHLLLEGFEKRVPGDPCFYLLAIWSPGETAQSPGPPKSCCNHQDTGNLCNEKTCFRCNSIHEERTQTVRGTILIPCRTANRGRFPLSGTYFQVNEVFADHETSLNPIEVPRSLLQGLKRPTVYCGTSLPYIVRGLSLEKINDCFCKGYFCVRAFDRKTRLPKRLSGRLHFVPRIVPKENKEPPNKNNQPQPRQQGVGKVRVKGNKNNKLLPI